MSNDEGHEIIDVEVEEITETGNLPAVVETPVRTYQHSEPITKWSEEWWKQASPEVQANRCVAHKKTGERCKNAAILGATVCRFHGGAAKHVKRAARARLENAADLMAKQLLGIALTADSEAVKLAAIKDSLDRAGLKAPSEVVLSQGEAKPYEQVFDVIGGNPPDAVGYDNAVGVDCVPPAMVDPADEQPQSSCHGGPLGQGRPREFDRQPRQQPPEVHITGEAAMRLANEANRQAGVFEAQRAIESPHKRYRRP